MVSALVSFVVLVWVFIFCWGAVEGSFRKDLRRMEELDRDHERWSAEKAAVESLLREVGGR
jgi:hypothetical protein